MAPFAVDGNGDLFPQSVFPEPRQSHLLMMAKLIRLVRPQPFRNDPQTLKLALILERVRKI